MNRAVIFNFNRERQPISLALFGNGVCGMAIGCPTVPQGNASLPVMIHAARAFNWD